MTALKVDVDFDYVVQKQVEALHSPPYASPFKGNIELWAWKLIDSLPDSEVAEVLFSLVYNAPDTVRNEVLRKLNE